MRTLAVLAVLAALASPVAIATAEPDTVIACTTTDAYAREMGDDDCNGRIDEDETGWSCATMGNQICGPVD